VRGRGGERECKVQNEDRGLGWTRRDCGVGGVPRRRGRGQERGTRGWWGGGERAEGGKVGGGGVCWRGNECEVVRRVRGRGGEYGEEGASRARESKNRDQENVKGREVIRKKEGGCESEGSRRGIEAGAVQVD